MPNCAFTVLNKKHHHYQFQAFLVQDNDRGIYTVARQWSNTFCLDRDPWGCAVPLWIQGSCLLLHLQCPCRCRPLLRYDNEPEWKIITQQQNTTSVDANDSRKLLNVLQNSSKNLSPFSLTAMIKKLQTVWSYWVSIFPVICMCNQMVYSWN